MRKTVFIKNALILTVTGLILRFAGILFKVWLASVIGSEGIGLYQLIFSVYVLASTFATSGISTAVTRLIAEELAMGSREGTLKILRRAVLITLIVAFFSAALLFFGSDFIAIQLLSDPRAAHAIRILPLSLPFMGISSCIKGYFIARRKVSPNAFCQILEQGVRIGLIFVLVKRFIKKGIAAACSAVMLGDVISESVSFLVIFLIYRLDLKKISLPDKGHRSFGIVKKILHIALPITSGRYLNSLLRTGENILVPKSLSKYPLSSASALSQFGMIKGMALPLLFFPSALLNAVSTLLIPEMSEASAKNQKGLVRFAASNILKLTALTSFIFAAVFLVAGEEIGFLIYKDKQVGFLLKALSPIVPLMYLDSVCDGILKGLDQQVWTFRTSISDSAIRILLIIFILPRFGLMGFIGIMYFSNLLTCILNVGRLLKVSGAKLKLFAEVLVPIGLSMALSGLARALLIFLNIESLLVYIISLCVLCLSSYFILLILFGILKISDIKAVFK